MQQEILHQTDAAIAQFTLLESGEHKTLQFCKIAVNSVIAKLTVEDALDIYYYIVGQAVDKESWTSSADRLQCVYDYFNDWIELELATRYA